MLLLEKVILQSHMRTHTNRHGRPTTHKIKSTFGPRAGTVIDEWHEKTSEGGVTEQQMSPTSSGLFPDRRSPKIHKLRPNDSLGATGLGTLLYII